MNRPRLTSVAFASALLMLVVLTVACSSPPEEALIRQFFRASQLRDAATLGNFAAATFDPNTDGVVTSFDLVSVSEERHEPLMLKDLAQAHEAAQKAADEFNSKKKAYQDANLPAIERVLKAESANRPVPARDAPVQAAWRKWRDEAAASAKAVSDARMKLNANLPVIELSLQGTGQTIDATAVDGHTMTKDVTINAEVRQPSGQTVQKQMVITMMRAEATGPGSAEPRVGRWVLTKIRTS